ncbi:MAG: hypothetical protein AVDCRST_MAG22-2515 [uncultured Rubrobacteraceae bacterium]|uniref:Uncharacterized protein n=1 Tax=uncultured Rubrobacteraceae bacterium TaxID=349277 RepID=A0A6J4PM92_9ACTN|nr:MAG: hypothetical protein AVDCRST_MAG22-2515 [uncultured Rubrobacteraceae bacterium]
MADRGDKSPRSATGLAALGQAFYLPADLKMKGLMSSEFASA